MGKLRWMMRLANILFFLFFATGVLFTLAPQGLAQTADTYQASNLDIRAHKADTASVAFSSGSETQSGTGSTTAGSNQNDWVHRWTRTVDKARASQPHFVAPIVTTHAMLSHRYPPHMGGPIRTTHVMLVQQYRYDMAWQQDPAGGTITSNYGASRGLEIIPTTRLEVGISPPPYIAHQSSLPDGFGDLAFQVKYRAFSAPEGQGDYFVGFFFGG